jgi:methylmalonyl-CoA mutase cobalamin-binding subunit
MFSTIAVPDSGPLVLTTTPINQQHEFGALMVSVAAASIGWRSIYLGPNLPAEDIAAIANQRKADAVAISIVYPPDDPRLNMELKTLRLLLDDRVRIISGGRSSSAYMKTLAEIGAIAVGDLTDLKEKLNAIRSELIGS